MRVQLVMLVFWVAVALPAHATPGQILYVQPEITNVRGAPSTSARVVMRLERGHKLMEFERRGKWIRVLIAGTLGNEGWVHGALVATRPLGDTSPSPTKSQTTGAREKERTEARPRTGFILDLSGSPAMAVRVSCQLVTRAGKRGHIEVESLTPKRFTFDGEALSCIVQKRDNRGRLEVALLRERSLIASAATAAPFNYVRVRSDGPWGNAKGTRGAVAIPLLRRKSARNSTVPSLSSPTIPPLRGTAVPPLRGTAVPPLRNLR